MAIVLFLLCRTTTETHYAAAEVEELLAMLRDTENLEEEGDILQYLMDSQGLQFETGKDLYLWIYVQSSSPIFLPSIFALLEGILEDGKPVTIRDLLKTLYHKACEQKLWGLVRHTAGMLGKRVEDLAKSVTDLVVRQKQVRRYND